MQKANIKYALGKYRAKKVNSVFEKVEQLILNEDKDWSIGAKTSD